MAQVVVYGHKEFLDRHKKALGISIHGALVDALDYPRSKCFQRFIGLDADDFVHPEDRGNSYVIVEVTMFEGRSDATKRKFIAELFRRAQSEVGVSPRSLEITIVETPRVNWGIRGGNGADLALSYEVEV